MLFIILSKLNNAINSFWELFASYVIYYIKQTILIVYYVLVMFASYVIYYIKQTKKK